MEEQIFENKIDAKSNRNIDFKEIWKYKGLIYLFTKRDISLTYRQTLLGPVWIFLKPLFNTVVYTFIFGRLANIPTDGIPDFMFYMCGSILWGMFSTIISTTGNVLVTNSYIFSKVYFPRIAMPISQSLVALFYLVIQLLMFFIFFIYYYVIGAPVRITMYILALPFVAIHVMALGMGTGLILSALTMKYRDLAIAIGFGLQLWMYITPIVYPYSMLGGITKMIASINPMTFPVEVFRKALLGEGTIIFPYYILSIIMTIVILFIGLKLFNKAERTSVDIV